MAIEKLSDKYNRLLHESKTAYDSGVEPTSRDISLQQKKRAALRKERGVEAAKMKADWYDDSNVGENNQKGYLDTVLNTLNMPLSAEVGLVESGLGKGSKKGVLNNMWANTKEHGTYGDLLRNYGLNNSVAAPLGFALDIIGDPFNMIGEGETSVLGKLYEGGKAGLRGEEGLLHGLGVAGKSIVNDTKMKTLGYVPGIKKAAFDVKNDTYLANKFRDLSARAYDSKKAFEDLTGHSLVDKVISLGQRNKLGNKLENKLLQSETGSDLVRNFKYSPKDFFDNQIGEAETLNEKRMKYLLKDRESNKELAYKFENTSGNTLYKDADKIESAKEAGRVIDKIDAFEDYNMLPSKNLTVREKNMKILGDTEAAYRKAVKKKMRYIGKDLFRGDSKAIVRLNGLNSLQKNEMYRMFDSYESGVKGYDKRIAKLLLSDRWRKVLKVNDVFSGLFKAAKVPGNILTSGTNAVFGNLLMTGMMGVDFMDHSFLSSMKQAVGIVRGHNAGAVEAFLKNKDWQEALDKYPKLFYSIYGMDPRLLTKTGDFVNDFAVQMEKNGYSDLNGYKEISDSYKNTIGKEMGRAKDMEELKQGVKSGASDMLQRAERATVESRTGVNAARRGVDTTMFSSEVLQGSYFDFVNKIKEAADRGVPFARLLNAYLNVPLEAYNKIDQAYKLGMSIKLANKGITGKELYRLGRRINFKPGDITEIAGRDLYMIKPMKAMEAANEAYMNYLAMPGFVRIMRKLPIIGSPFFSFAYGINALAGKSLMNNPGFYNKVQNAIHEISGNKSPLEKKALTGKYNSWLNSPTMMKLPFFSENPYYLDMSNLIPYYSMNLMQNSNRSYKNKYGNAVAKVVDNTPFMKTPEGQILMDYGVFPFLINRGERPKGMFGQPLWSKHAGLAEKTGAFLKSATEIVLPPSAGVTGFFAPQQIAKYAPLYRFAQAANAKAGRTSLGIPSKVPASERVMTTASSMFGLPVHKVNLDLVNKLKK